MRDIIFYHNIQNHFLKELMKLNKRDNEISRTISHEEIRETCAQQGTWANEVSIYRCCCISREYGGKSFVKIYECFVTNKGSFTAMISFVLLIALIVCNIRLSAGAASPEACAG